MKRILHVINSIFCLALMGLGVLIIACNRDADEDWMMIYTIIWGAQIVLAFVMFLIGALLPKEGKYISRRARRIVKIVLILSVLGGNGPGNAAAYNLMNDGFKVQRFWEPAFPLTCFFFELGISIFFPGTGLMRTAIILSLVILFLLFLLSVWWKILECRENNILTWYNVILPSLIITAIFLLIFLITCIMEWRRGASLQEELADKREKIEETLDSYSYGETGENETPLPHEDLDMEGVLDLVKEDFKTEVYYRWVGGEDDVYSLVVWNDESDDVYVYQFAVDGDRYDLETEFVSGALSIEDVKGKEDGVIR